MTVEVKGYGKITANKSILNSLSLVFDTAEEKYKAEGKETMAKIMNEASWSIYNALNETGYYKD